MNPAHKIALALPEISRRLRSAALPPPSELDLVVGVATGGIVPASLVAHQLGLPLQLLALNFRAADNRPQRDLPELLGRVPEVAGRRILVVDDVSVTGATLARAAALLPAASVRTMVFKGPPGCADVVLFPDLPSCVAWPWKLEDAPW